MYDGEVKLADDVVGLILKDIRRSNLDGDSIVILLSDHGEGFWEHGLWEHGNSLYNELLHVPLIIHSPGRLPRGKTVKELARTVDLLPTILDLVGIEYNERELRGNSLLPLMKDEELKTARLSSPAQARFNDKNRGRMAFSEFPHTRMIFGRSIQSVEEKLIDPDLGDTPLEYYEITEDPKELNNQAQDEGEKASELMDIMNEISSSTSNNRAKYPDERHEPSEETITKLKSLGYVQ
jgi:arylsulfatase A-like enzyme